ncbi:MAG TPA: DNA mismatch repair endonuclease MutL [Gemmatimonadaceae bacterium]
MPRIAILPSAVADQIAAGEVVERPASVVKELVENALDAGATSIDVAVEDGGRARSRVSDDGSGMDREDARLALARHATSKIRDASDLVGVPSFGFRGEALPAICSVSRLELETATRDGDGTRLVAAGGTVERVEEAARRRGTTVTVAQLFFNTPARRKFLRGARSEWRAILDAVTTVALLRRDVRLTLAHDGATVFSLPPAPSLRARVAALWGQATSDRLADVEDVRGTTHVSGLVELPSSVGTAARRVLLAVNGRAVRDAGIVRAAEAAYRSTIQAGLRPSLLLELTVPAAAIDVNVHPAKAEIRFHDRWPVERVVEDAVRRALGAPESASFLGVRTWSAAADAPAVDVEVLHAPPAVHGALFAAAEDAEAATEAPPPDEPEIDVPPLVQLRRTYLMFERDDAVVLIDQHSAHERVLYERFMRQLETGEAPSQRLLFPLTLHLAPAEGEAFEANQELFARLGYDADGFGGHTLLVRDVPAPHPRFDAERCLRDTLAALAGDRQGSAAARHERLAATVACKAAIKAGDPLAPAEMRALFVALAATTLPAHDVHGRSTIVRVGWDELERRFGRR